MRAGSGSEPGNEPDPWSQPADFAEPGPAEQQEGPTVPQPEPGGYPSAPPGSWSAPPPAAWGDPSSRAQPTPPGDPAPPQPDVSDATTRQQRPDGFSPANADPWAAPAGGFPSPAGQYQSPPAGQYQAAVGGQFQQPAAPHQQPTQQFQQPSAQYQPGQYQPGQYPPGQYQPPGPYSYQSPYYPGAAPRNNPVAIAALVCGIAQILGFLVLLGNILLAIPAIICGAIALRQIRERGERGRGMAIAGLVLGIVGIVIFVIFLALVIVAVVYRKSSS